MQDSLIRLMVKCAVLVVLWCVTCWQLFGVLHTVTCLVCYMLSDVLCVYAVSCLVCYMLSVVWCVTLCHCLQPSGCNGSLISYKL